MRSRPIIARLARLLQWIGASGTLLLIAMILARGRVHLTVAIVGFACWMLSPYIGVWHQQRKPAGTTWEQAVSLVAVTLIVAYGAYAYLAGWVFYSGPTRSTGQGMIAVIVPFLQWTVLGIGAVLRRGVRIAARRRAQWDAT